MPPAVPLSWFNLETAEPESTRVEVEPWRRDTSLPMLLEVSMLHRNAAAEAVEAGEEAYSAAVVLERWSILFVRGDLGERPKDQRPTDQVQFLCLHQHRAPVKVIAVRLPDAN